MPALTRRNRGPNGPALLPPLARFTRAGFPVPPAAAPGPPAPPPAAVQQPAVHPANPGPVPAAPALPQAAANAQVPAAAVLQNADEEDDDDQADPNGDSNEGESPFKEEVDQADQNGDSNEGEQSSNEEGVEDSARPSQREGRRERPRTPSAVAGAGATSAGASRRRSDQPAKPQKNLIGPQAFRNAYSSAAEKRRGGEGDDQRTSSIRSKYGNGATRSQGVSQQHIEAGGQHSQRPQQPAQNGDDIGERALGLFDAGSPSLQNYLRQGLLDLERRHQASDLTGHHPEDLGEYLLDLVISVSSSHNWADDRPLVDAYEDHIRRRAANATETAEGGALAAESPRALPHAGPSDDGRGQSDEAEAEKQPHARAKAAIRNRHTHEKRLQWYRRGFECAHNHTKIRMITGHDTLYGNPFEAVTAREVCEWTLDNIDEFADDANFDLIPLPQELILIQQRHEVSKAFEAWENWMTSLPHVREDELTKLSIHGLNIVRELGIVVLPNLRDDLNDVEVDTVGELMNLEDRLCAAAKPLVELKWSRYMQYLANVTDDQEFIDAQKQRHKEALIAVREVGEIISPPLLAKWPSQGFSSQMPSLGGNWQYLAPLGKGGNGTAHLWVHRLATSAPHFRDMGTPGWRPPVCRNCFQIHSSVLTTASGMPNQRRDTGPHHTHRRTSRHLRHRTDHDIADATRPHTQ